MQQQTADFSGWGSKQGSKVKTWKKRFFVLRGRELVYYSGGGGSNGDEKGRLTVVGADFAPDLKNGLLIRGEKKNKTQVLKMKTATADESKAWLLKIRQAVAGVDVADAYRSASFRSRSVSGSTVSTASSASSRNFAAAATPAARVPPPSYQSQRSLSEPGAATTGEYFGGASSLDEKRGWLLKEGSKVKSWKKRFFVLRGTVLTYYTDERSSPKLGSIVVRDVETNFTTPFTLDVHAEGGRLLRIAADSLADIEAWDLALSQVIANKNRPAEKAPAPRAVTESLSTASSSSLASFDSFREYGKVQFRESVSLFDDDNDNEVFPAIQEDAATSSPSHEPPASSVYASHVRATSGSGATTVEGWLLKQGRTSKQWKRRFFSLTNDLLEYRHTPEDFPNEDEVVVDVVFEKDDSRRVHIELDSGRTITVAAETQAEFERWASALSGVTGKLFAREDEFQQSQTLHNVYEDEDEEEIVEAHSIEAEPVAVAQVVAVPVEPEIKYGWLLKQGSLIRSWKRRYFVLEGDSLQYFEHIDKPARGGGTVSRVVRDGDEGADVVGDNCLDVHLTNGRILKISSELSSELSSWYAALLNASRLLAQTNDVDGLDDVDDDELDFSGVDSSNQQSVAPRLQKKLGQEGWLLKKGQNFKTWKQRYFVLERSRLVYYDNDTKQEGRLLGSGVVFEVGVGESRPFCIDVRFQNGRLLQVVASDQAQFSVWLAALQNASNLTESFLSQHDDDAGNNSSNAAVFDDEFDLDFGDEEVAAGEALNFGSSNQLDHDAGDDAKSGYSTWAAAMDNKPEWERSGSYDSSVDGEDNSSVADAPLTPTAEAAGRADSDPLAAQQCVCSGWLNKEGGTIKSWKRRYFSLHGTTLRYFKSESGSLLRSFTITRVEEQPALPLGLEVTTTTDRTLVLTAESKEDFAKWLSGMRGALLKTGAAGQAAVAAEDRSGKPQTAVESSRLSIPMTPTKAKASASPAASVSASPAAAVATEAGRASAATTVSATVNVEGKTVTAYSGWLEKEGQRFKTWKKRYFTYKKGALLYFSEIGGVAHGHGIVTDVRVDASKPFTLSIQLESERELRVSAASAEEMDTWLQVLSSAKPPTQSSSSSAAASPAVKAQTQAHDRKSEHGNKDASHSSVASSSQNHSQAAAAAALGRGAARERISDRLDPNDYLANDTISNESFLRIQEGQADASFVQASFNVGHQRSFKGDLDFASSPDVAAAAAGGGKSGEADESEAKRGMRTESTEDLEYYRSLLAESELEREKREAETGVHSVNGCAACCIVM